MNRKHTRSMSFSHETAEATVLENRCYGAAIGATLATLLGIAGPISADGQKEQPFLYDSKPALASTPHELAFQLVAQNECDWTLGTNIWRMHYLACVQDRHPD